MATTTLNYGTSNQTVTITLASLANDAYRESTAVSNTTNKYIDVLLAGKVTTGTSPTANKQILVYAYGTADGGTTYSGNATGTDAAYSPTDNQAQNLMLLGVISTSSTSDKTCEFGPFSIASAFGGNVPASWGIVIKNETGVALNATGSNHAVFYQGIDYTSA